MEAVGVCPSSMFREIKVVASKRSGEVVYRAIVEVPYPQASVKVSGRDGSYTVHVVERGFARRRCEIASFKFKVQEEVAEVEHAILYASNLPLDDLECILKIVLRHLHESWKPQRVEISPRAIFLNISEGQLAVLLRDVGGFPT